MNIKTKVIKNYGLFLVFIHNTCCNNWYFVQYNIFQRYINNISQSTDVLSILFHFNQVDDLSTNSLSNRHILKLILLINSYKLYIGRKTIINWRKNR